MKISASKVLALGGLCALFVGAGNVAFAQGGDHQDRNNDPGQSRQSDRHSDYGQNHYGGGQDSQYRQSSQYRHANQTERRRLDRLHAAYAHAAANGNYGAAERAHLHAQAIRARLRAQHGGDNQNHHDDQGRHDTN